MNFEHKLNDLIILINDNLNKELKKSKPEIIYNAMSYSVNAGGKRVRPILLLSFCELFCNNISFAIDFACAIELIHTYSLIHDDLPSMDNDDYRRGLPTCHKKFGESIAILAGDGLLNLSIEIMLNFLKNNFEPKYLEAMNLIFKSSGVKGMIGGQVEDIISENKQVNKEDIVFIHTNKTGKLIYSSIISGAIIGNASDNEIKKLEKLANSVGLAFQIQDDILDFTSDTKTLGKPVFSDVKNNKSTYVTLFGLEKSMEEYKKHCDKVLFSLEEMGFKSKFIYYYIKKLFSRLN